MCSRQHRPPHKACGGKGWEKNRRGGQAKIGKRNSTTLSSRSKCVSAPATLSTSILWHTLKASPSPLFPHSRFARVDDHDALHVPLTTSSTGNAMTVFRLCQAVLSDSFMPTETKRYERMIDSHRVDGRYRLECIKCQHVLHIWLLSLSSPQF